LRVKFPLVAEVAELDAARKLLDMELERARSGGVKTPEPLEVGVMLEVPALLWQLDALLPSVDFVSVGSNDLLQYLYAADRGNPRVGARYDPLAPAFLSALNYLVESCRTANVPLCLCGEMAAQPLEAMALVGLGFRMLSMAPQAVGPVKETLRSIDAGQLRAYLAPHLRSRDHSLREKLRDFARDHHVLLEDVAGSG
jgi:phosphotransferase system enzyme I (PtsP)